MSDSGIVKLVSKAEKGKYKTISQVAGDIGRSVSTIKAAIRSGKVEGPTHRMSLGDGTTGAFVWLYTEKDIDRLHEHFASVEWGRPRESNE